MILLFGIIKFRNDFEMIFRFSYAPLFHISMTGKTGIFFVMIRGISPCFRNEVSGQSYIKDIPHSEKAITQSY